MNVTKLENFERFCCGCSACKNICMLNAISMELDNEGFYFPVVNEDVCIQCGKCLDVCQFISEYTEKKKRSDDNTICFSAYAKDDSIRLRSSSGGVFGLFADFFRNKDGEVFAAVFDSETKSVRHGRLGDYTLEELCRSKYLQSDLKNTYMEIETCLKKEKRVLFCGTPCQVKGLRKYLGIDYENLLLVDFACHGVASVRIFLDMLQEYEREYGSKIIDVTFREKDNGWQDQVMKFYFEDGRVITEVSKNHYYNYLFLENYSLRKSCFTCDYLNSQADIRLEDFWGMEKARDEKKGVSFVRVYDIKGKEILKDLKDKIEIMSIDYKANDINYAGREQGKYDENKRNNFFVYYLKNGLKKSVNKWVKPKLRKRKIRLILKKCKQKIGL